jgi:pimeloyl-ACP methyl ester carboxylesterase
LLGGHQHRAVAGAAACLGRFTSREWIGDLAAPAVVVVTTHDGIVPPRRQRKLAVALGAPTVEVASGHLVARSDPARLAAAILAAADRLVPVRPVRPVRPEAA